jgi:hypothetical protein
VALEAALRLAVLRKTFGWRHESVLRSSSGARGDAGGVRGSTRGSEGQWALEKTLERARERATGR